MADFWTSIGDMLGLNKGNATENAAGLNQGILDQLQRQGQGYLTQAEGNTSALRDLFMHGANTYADALGINGPEGNANATAAFQHSPGYTQALDQGNQSILRSAAARGNLGGGGTDIDLMRYGVGAADSDYNNWLGNLSGYNGLATTATGMENGSLGNLTQFAEDIASGHMNANNQQAAGAEAGQGALWDTLNNVAGVAGSFMGMGGMPGGGGAPAAPTGYRPAFGGYGSY